MTYPWYSVISWKVLVHKKCSAHVCTTLKTNLSDSYVHTIVWKIFVWNYFVVENVQENNFRG